MSSRLRSLDSKISFFAFADIITAVSGVLIFVALLLATDLGLPTDSKAPSTNPDVEQQIQEILAQQVDVDAQNQRLQELLTTANTSPDPDKLQADIKRLRAQLADEQKKQAVLLQQMSQSQAAIAKRDAELGLTSLKAQIEREKDTTKDIAAKEAEVKSEITALDQHIAGLQSKLLQLRQREGKLWLIPEKGTTTKEPILAIVSKNGISLERFDHPEKTKQIGSATARTDFEDYVKELKSADEYVVFLIRPSGVALFQDLVKTARDRNIEVGFDAIEEDKDIYFTSPPVLDETVPVSSTTGYTSGSGGYSNPSGGGGNSFEGTGSSGAGNTGAAGSSNGSTGGNLGGKTGGNVGGISGDNNSGSAGGNQNGGASGNKGGIVGGSVNGAGTGTTPGNGTQTGGAFSSGAGGSGTGGNGLGTGSSGSGAGKGSGNGKGKGSGNSDSATAGKGNRTNGNASVKTNTTTSEVKKEEPKTNNVPATKPPTTVAKSWWQRFLDWLRSFFK